MKALLKRGLLGIVLLTAGSASAHMVDLGPGIVCEDRQTGSFCAIAPDSVCGPKRLIALFAAVVSLVDRYPMHASPLGAGFDPCTSPLANLMPDIRSHAEWLQDAATEAHCRAAQYERQAQAAAAREQLLAEARKVIEACQ